MDVLLKKIADLTAHMLALPMIWRWMIWRRCNSFMNQPLVTHKLVEFEKHYKDHDSKPLDDITRGPISLQNVR